MSAANKLRKRNRGPWDAEGEIPDARQQPELKISYRGYAIFSSEAEKAYTERLAVEELYKEITGKDANGKASKDLLSEVEGTNRRPINLVIVRIDPNNVTGSFVESMKDIDKFLTLSKQRFVRAAIAHLGTLDPERQPDEIQKLSRALVKAHCDGHLKGHEQAFDELRNHPALKRALNDATTEFLANSLRNIDRVPEGPRQQLLADAFSHLENLKNSLSAHDGEKSKFGQKFSLSYELGQVQYNGHVKKHEEALAKLYPDKPTLDRALSDASTDFFAGSIRNIERFPEGSRQQLFTNAISHFGRLDPEHQADEVKKLSHVLAKAHYDGHLQEQENKLANLRKDEPALDRALNAGTTDFFTGSIKNLDKFIGESRQQLLTGALIHFEKLDPDNKIEKTEIYKLSHAFVAARESGLLNERVDDLATLRAKKPALDRALSYAEKKYHENDAGAKFEASAGRTPPLVPRAGAVLDDRGPRDPQGRC